MVLGEAEMAFFDGQFSLLRECCETIRHNARQTLDLISVYQLQAQYHAAHHQFRETLEVVSEALQMLDSFNSSLCIISIYQGKLGTHKITHRVHFWSSGNGFPDVDC